MGRVIAIVPEHPWRGWVDSASVESDNIRDAARHLSREVVLLTGLRQDDAWMVEITEPDSNVPTAGYASAAMLGLHDLLREFGIHEFRMEHFPMVIRGSGGDLVFRGRTVKPHAQGAFFFVNQKE